MLADNKRNTPGRWWILCGTAFVATLGQRALGDWPYCGPLPCPEFSAEPAMIAEIVPESVTEDQRCLNPAGSESWTAGDWAYYFGAYTTVYERDKKRRPYWTYTCDPVCFSCGPMEWTDWYELSGGPIEVTWSFVNDDPPDLTEPGAYSLEATFENLPDDDPPPPGCERWEEDDPETCFFFIDVESRGKCCHIEEDLLSSGCIIETEEDCLDRNTMTPPEYVYGGGDACCDPTGACWKYEPGPPPQPCVNNTTDDCCDQWKTENGDFLPGETCCGVTEGSGIWKELDWSETCNECWGGSNPIASKQDSCGNTIEIRCEGSGWPTCSYQYKFYYNGYHFT